MTDVMRAILHRVLNEEIKNQEAWKKADEENGFPTEVRDTVITEIRGFMRENNIDD